MKASKAILPSLALALALGTVGCNAAESDSESSGDGSADGGGDDLSFYSMLLGAILLNDPIGDFLDSDSNLNDSAIGRAFIDIIGDVADETGPDVTLGEAIDFVIAAGGSGGRVDDAVVAVPRSADGSIPRQGVLPGGASMTTSGPFIAYNVTFQGDIPLSGPDYLTYALVADTDGDDANNFVPLPSFDNDLFQGTDWWFQLNYDAGTDTWSAEVATVDSSNSVSGASSNAAAVITGSNIVFIVPTSDVPSSASVRATAFVHDGNFTPGARGADTLPEPMAAPAPISSILLD